jgi:hypothetical protein
MSAPWTGKFAAHIVSFKRCQLVEICMPSYIVTAYCEKCSANHPTGVELDWPGQIPPNKSILEAFNGTSLPLEIVMMSRNYFLCPQTGKMYKVADNKKAFLAQTK